MTVIKTFTSSLPLLSSIFLTILLCFPRSMAAGTTCNSNDKKALLAIKAAFHHPHFLASWNHSTECCYWDGIQCDAADGRVTSLRFSGDPNLSGFLPDVIADLPFLTNLLFSDLPLVTGPIPSSLSRLSRLSTLILRNNSLSGAVPAFLSNITSLRLLDLSFNLLTGSIPAELSHLRALFFLHLNNNQLSGAIPAAFGSFSTSSPLELDLSNNHLSGRIPRELGWPEWGHIDLSNNRLGGDASVLFGAGKGTTRINLSSNRLRFDLSRVSFPENLAVLYLNRNEITGSIPAQINNLTHLIVLNLSENRLCHAIPVGPVTAKFGKEAFADNMCLCGFPLDPCPISN